MADRTLTGWRAQVAALIERVNHVIRETDESLGLDTGNGPYAWQLLDEARSLFQHQSQVLRTGSPEDYYGLVILPAQALLLGARDMSDTHRALTVMLELAVADLAKAAEILDVAEVAHG